MLNYIKMENFRKHADLTVTFTPGINTIRADNERGKSSMLEAIAYAYFGAAGLKESIDDVVTYDMPVSKLKVEHGFTLAGVDYKIVRSSKGAELTFGREVVTGQKEVTKFVEGLFGASQAMSAKLMLAKQKDLGGALADGPTAAGKMIEDLADLELINELTTKISERLPAGNTDVQKSTVSTLREQAAEPKLEDLEPLLSAEREARLASSAAVEHYGAVKAQLDNLDLAAAREILVNERVLNEQICAASITIASTEAKLALPVPPAPKDGAIEALQAKIVAQKDLEAAGRLHAELKAADTAEAWDEPLAALQAAVVQAELDVTARQESLREIRAGLDAGNKDRRAAISVYAVEQATLTGKLIKDTTCALCQKDLKDVPEVARINSLLNQQLIDLEMAYSSNLADIDEQLGGLNEELFEDEKLLAQEQQYLADLQAVVRKHEKLQGLYGRAAAYITLDERVVPAQWTWTGPTGAPQNFSGELARLQEQQSAHLRAEADRTALAQINASAVAQRARAEVSLAALQLTDARETLELEVALKPQVQAALEVTQRAERTMLAARQAYDMAQQRNTLLTTANERARAGLATAEATLAEMEANNLLIKKLRAARPVIADQLWAIVLAACSTYAGDVRGEKSTISRADGRFKINGRPITGLSGSAEDVLGLSVRYALTKTFLPNVDFVILDEVAAACDDQRELAMLGLLATSGFGQTILVTHSQHADAFSDNIITF